MGNMFLVAHAAISDSVTIEIARRPDFSAALRFARNDMVRDTIHTK
jgi:hypothetical protein